jgi:hypothetical protein
MKRRAPVASKVFDDAYRYTCPTDLKGFGIIDLVQQGERILDSRLKLTTAERFDRKKSIRSGWVAFEDDDYARTLLLDIAADDTATTVAELDTLTGDGGTWAVYSAGATNLAADDENLIQGGGSLSFDLASGTTTAGIKNSSLTTFDLTDYNDTGSAFVWAYILATANITNFILEIGNDTSNYYSMTATTAADGTAFQVGWNLLRFDFSGKTTTGTVTATAGDHVGLYMTKTSGKTGNGYKFDFLTLHTGQYFDVVYYSKYAWESSTGTYKENSTTSTDLIHADTDELELYVLKGKEIAAVEITRNLNLGKYYGDKYAEARSAYRRRYPSEAIKREDNYY